MSASPISEMVFHAGVGRWVKRDRIPCINPRCRRTAPADKYDPGVDIICGRCFRALPPAIKTENRRCWREIRKWEKRITRTGDELKIERMRAILGRWIRRLDENWREIRAQFTDTAKPEGLDAFLEETGL